MLTGVQDLKVVSHLLLNKVFLLLGAMASQPAILPTYERELPLLQSSGYLPLIIIL